MAHSGGLSRSIFFAVAVLAGGACGDGGEDGGGKQTGPAGDGSVEIVNFVFTPANLTVKPGAKVTWTNGDTAVHSIKDTSPLATPVSPDMAKDATFSITYGQPGSYSYICGIHQYMTGSVTVAP
ncbi:MAG TPA: cupredoxin domain-containing protein [Acidimicrobiia bacterium]|nr:cupredoxin domain-containing protein [Acidimicrobiia bacterium]